MLQVVLFYQYGPDWARVIDKLPEHALPGERIWARVMEFEDGKPSPPPGAEPVPAGVEIVAV